MHTMAVRLLCDPYIDPQDCPSTNAAAVQGPHETVTVTASFLNLADDSVAVLIADSGVGGGSNGNGSGGNAANNGTPLTPEQKKTQCLNNFYNSKLGNSRKVWQSPCAAARLESSVGKQLARVGNRHFWKVRWSVRIRRDVGYNSTHYAQRNGNGRLET